MTMFCPYCKWIIPEAERVITLACTEESMGQKDGADLEPGDFHLCWNCRQIARVNLHLQLRPLTDREESNMPIWAARSVFLCQMSIIIYDRAKAAAGTA